MDILDEQEPKPNFLIWLEVIKFYVLATRRIGFPFPRAFNDLIESGDYIVYDDGGYRHYMCLID